MQKDLCFIYEDKVEVYHTEYYNLLEISPYFLSGEVLIGCQVLDLITNEIINIDCKEFRMCNRKVACYAYQGYKKIKDITYKK